MAGIRIISFITCFLLIFNFSAAATFGQDVPEAVMGMGGDVLERAIDPHTYLIGPGDILSINIWGGLENQLLCIVSPEGNLSVPTVGDMKVGGLVLSEAKEVIEEAVGRVYYTSKTNVFLHQLRRFRISVTGMVANSGIYESFAIDRVSHLLKKAGGLITDSSLRNIKLIHENGDTTNVDLLMYMRCGDVDNNPFVREGDAIFIPPISLETGLLEIFGAVKIPGTIEYTPDDNIGDIISVSGGFTDDAKLDEIFISRCIGNSPEFTSYKLDISRPGSDWDFIIHADDRVFVRSHSNYHLRQAVKVSGEVQFPGVYPIIEKKSTLKDIISQAGGFTDKANLSDAEVIRRTEEELLDPEFERLKLIPVADMSEMEYEYYKTKSREKTMVVVDFRALFEGGDDSQNIYLRDNDSIFIPLQAKTVKVTGQVNNPGLIDWEPGKNHEYYIKKAGSLSFNARKGKIRIIRASTGKWIRPKSDTIINIGDTIFIPEKPERDYWAFYKDMLLVLTQMATIFVVVKTLK